MPKLILSILTILAVPLLCSSQLYIGKAVEEIDSLVKESYASWKMKNSEDDQNNTYIEYIDNDNRRKVKYHFHSITRKCDYIEYWYELYLKEEVIKNLNKEYKKNKNGHWLMPQPSGVIYKAHSIPIIIDLDNTRYYSIRIQKNHL